MQISYDCWQTEIDLREAGTPFPAERRVDRPTDSGLMSGFWRIEAARTKIDWPVAIWTREGEEVTIFQIGEAIRNTAKHPDEWENFATFTWLKCSAVTEAEYHAALESKVWPDGKAARRITEEERLGLDHVPDTPREEGGNYQPGDPDDVLGDAVEGQEREPIPPARASDAFHSQIARRIAEETEKAKALPAITTLEIANDAAAIVENLRGLGKRGEAKRKAERLPFDDEITVVQGKWVPVLKPASDLVTSLVDRIDKWRKAEDARIAAEAKKKRDDEIARLAEEEAKRLAAQREEQERLLRAEAEASGDTSSTVIVHDEEAERAEAQRIAEAQLPPAEPPPRTRVGTAHGRAISKPKRKVGKIVDVDVFIGAIKTRDDFAEFLQQTANKLARADAKTPGMEISEE